MVSTDKPYDPSPLTTSGFAVTGLADSANLVAFYEKYGFQARLAVNWRTSTSITSVSRRTTRRTAPNRPS